MRSGGLVLVGVPLALSPQVQFLLRLRRLLFPSARQLQLERVEAVWLSMRGRLADLFRHHHLLFRLNTAWGYLFPGMGDGVLILAERTLT